MTEAMPFLQKAILLSYAPRPLAGGHDFRCREVGRLPEHRRRRLRHLFRLRRELSIPWSLSEKRPCPCF